jgi:hypothetical protein
VWRRRRGVGWGLEVEVEGIELGEHNGKGGDKEPCLPVSCCAGERRATDQHQYQLCATDQRHYQLLPNLIRGKKGQFNW